MSDRNQWSVSISAYALRQCNALPDRPNIRLLLRGALFSYMDFQSLLTSPLVPYETLPGKPFTGRCIVSSPVDISKGVVEAIRRGAEKYCAREGWAEELDFLSSNSPHAFVNKCLEHFLVNYDVSMPMPTKKAFAAKLATYLHEAPATQGTNV